MRSIVGVAAGALTFVLGSSCARAPIGPYRGPQPAPGAITAFDTRWDPDVHKESKAGAPPFLVPGTTRRSLFSAGNVDIPSRRDSVAILVYGDNRPGIRMMKKPWGLPADIERGRSDPRRHLMETHTVPAG